MEPQKKKLKFGINTSPKGDLHIRFSFQEILSRGFIEWMLYIGEVPGSNLPLWIGYIYRGYARNSSVSPESGYRRLGYGLEHCGIVPIFDSQKRHFSWNTQHHVQWVTGALALRSKPAGGVKLTTYLQLFPRWKYERSYTTTPHAPSWLTQRPTYFAYTPPVPR